jgi:hypothetical protein
MYRATTSNPSPCIASLKPQDRLGHLDDFFFSHNWGDDELGRNNHLRVENLALAMKSFQFNVWLDSFKLQAGGGANQGGFKQSICTAIDSSTVFVACLTRSYMRKVRDGADFGQDNCQFEFNLATHRVMPLSRIVVLVMEPFCLKVSNWSGPVLGVCGDKLYIDFSDDTKLEAVIKALSTALMTIIPSGKRENGSLIPAIQAGSLPTVFKGGPRALQSQRFDLCMGDVVNVKLQSNFLRGVVAIDALGCLMIEVLPQSKEGNQSLPAQIYSPAFQVESGSHTNQVTGGIATLSILPQPSAPGSLYPDLPKSSPPVEIALGQDALPLLQTQKATKGHKPADFKATEIVAVPRSDGSITYAQVLSVDVPPTSLGLIRVLTRRGAVLVEKEINAGETYKIYGTFSVLS